MAIAWQEYDQGVYERLGVAGRAAHGNAPAARLFLAFAIHCMRAPVNRSVDSVCTFIADTSWMMYTYVEILVHRAYNNVIHAVGASY